jgi:hypothetical protein
MVGGEDIEYGWHWSSIQLNNGVDISSTYLFNAVTREVVDQYTIVVCCPCACCFVYACKKTLLVLRLSLAIITAHDGSGRCPQASLLSLCYILSPADLHTLFFFCSCF